MCSLNPETQLEKVYEKWQPLLLTSAERIIILRRIYANTVLIDLETLKQPRPSLQDQD